MLHFFANDSLKQAAQAAGEAQKSGGGSDWILHHIYDAHTLDFEPFGVIKLPELHLMGYDISITKHVVFMWISALLLMVIFALVRRSYKRSIVPRGGTNLIEMIVVFVRDDIAKQNIGKGYEKFLPYLLTVFFFILTGNFLGLIPYSATFTSNISVTATLAITSFAVIQIGGIAHNGFFKYLKGLVPHGVHWLLFPLMFVVEFIGLFTKPFALAIRLFANMTAGHIVILALLGLIFFLHSFAVAPISIAFALFIYMLELLVALLQAYIFTMLSSLFIGMSVHQH